MLPEGAAVSAAPVKCRLLCTAWLRRMPDRQGGCTDGSAAADAELDWLPPGHDSMLPCPVHQGMLAASNGRPRKRLESPSPRRSGGPIVVAAVG